SMAPAYSPPIPGLYPTPGATMRRLGSPSSFRPRMFLPKSPIRRSKSWRAFASATGTASAQNVTSTGAFSVSLTDREPCWATDQKRSLYSNWNPRVVLGQIVPFRSGADVSVGGGDVGAAVGLEVGLGVGPPRGGFPHGPGGVHGLG